MALGRRQRRSRAGESRLAFLARRIGRPLSSSSKTRHSRHRAATRNSSLPKDEPTRTSWIHGRDTRPKAPPEAAQFLELFASREQQKPIAVAGINIPTAIGSADDPATAAEALRKAGIEIPYPRRDVNIMGRTTPSADNPPGSSLSA